jgi:hypothetical protein
MPVNVGIDNVKGNILNSNHINFLKQSKIDKKKKKKKKKKKSNTMPRKLSRDQVANSMVWMQEPPLFTKYDASRYFCNSLICICYSLKYENKIKNFEHHCVHLTWASLWVV